MCNTWPLQQTPAQTKRRKQPHLVRSSETHAQLRTSTLQTCNCTGRWPHMDAHIQHPGPACCCRMRSGKQKSEPWHYYLSSANSKISRFAAETADNSTDQAAGGMFPIDHQLIDRAQVQLAAQHANSRKFSSMSAPKSLYALIHNSNTERPLTSTRSKVAGSVPAVVSRLPSS